MDVSFARVRLHEISVGSTIESHVKFADIHILAGLKDRIDDSVASSHKERGST